MKTKGMVSNVKTADSCIGLIEPCQCSVALGMWCSVALGMWCSVALGMWCSVALGLYVVQCTCTGCSYHHSV